LGRGRETQALRRLRADFAEIFAPFKGCYFWKRPILVRQLGVAVFLVKA
jgi:hypothetical protein